VKLKEQKIQQLEKALAQAQQDLAFIEEMNQDDMKDVKIQELELRLRHLEQERELDQIQRQNLENQVLERDEIIQAKDLLIEKLKSDLEPVDTLEEDFLISENLVGGLEITLQKVKDKVTELRQIPFPM